MMRKKKSQVAIEFLVTYGWAILAVMVVVGALSYFGVFNTKRYINDECNFGTQLYCEDFRLQQNGGYPVLDLTIRNNYDVPIVINSFNVTSKYYPSAVDCTATMVIPSIAPGGEQDISCSISNTDEVNIPLDERVDATIMIGYSRQGSSIRHGLTGKVKATVI
ncbi:MAG: hypothetical protein ACP5NV_00455 [Candidatus Woesearchaeota archaeon]